MLVSRTNQELYYVFGNYRVWQFRCPARGWKREVTRENEDGTLTIIDLHGEEARKVIMQKVKYDRENDIFH